MASCCRNENATVNSLSNAAPRRVTASMVVFGYLFHILVTSPRLGFCPRHAFLPRTMSETDKLLLVLFVFGLAILNTRNIRL